MSDIVGRLCDLHSELHSKMDKQTGIHIFYANELSSIAETVLDAATVADKYRLLQIETATLRSEISDARPGEGWQFKRGDRVQKSKGSSWHGVVVGFYSNEQTPRGYVVESERERGSSQIYPEAALRAVEGDSNG